MHLLRIAASIVGLTTAAVSQPTFSSTADDATSQIGTDQWSLPDTQGASQLTNPTGLPLSARNTQGTEIVCDALKTEVEALSMACEASERSPVPMFCTEGTGMVMAYDPDTKTSHILTIDALLEMGYEPPPHTCLEVYNGYRDLDKRGCNRKDSEHDWVNATTAWKLECTDPTGLKGKSKASILGPAIGVPVGLLVLAECGLYLYWRKRPLIG